MCRVVALLREGSFLLLVCSSVRSAFYTPLHFFSVVVIVSLQSTILLLNSGLPFFICQIWVKLSFLFLFYSALFRELAFFVNESTHLLRSKMPEIVEKEKNNRSHLEMLEI